MGCEAGSLVALPPVARTLPSGNTVRLWKVRPNAIDPTCCHPGVGWFMSSTYAVFSDGATGIRPGAPGLPDFKITPGRYIAELPPATAKGSIRVQVCVAMSSAWVWIVPSLELAYRTRPSGRTNMWG